MQHLPDDAQKIADAQGWDDESIVIHLVGYLKRMGISEGLASYFATVAAEENADATALGSRSREDIFVKLDPTEGLIAKVADQRIQTRAGNEDDDGED